METQLLFQGANPFAATATLIMPRHSYIANGTDVPLFLGDSQYVPSRSNRLNPPGRQRYKGREKRKLCLARAESNPWRK